MYNFENKMLVNELKGLLDGLKQCVIDTKFDLAVDNIHELNQRTAEMRKIIDRIEEKSNVKKTVFDEFI